MSEAKPAKPAATADEVRPDSANPTEERKPGVPPEGKKPQPPRCN